MHILSTRVELRRVPIVESITTDEYEDDYPVMALSPGGSLAVSWIGYRNETDQVFVREREQDKWGPITPVDGATGDLQGLAAAHDGQGSLHLVWSRRTGEAWELLHAVRSGTAWSAPRTVPADVGNNLFPVLAAGPIRPTAPRVAVCPDGVLRHPLQFVRRLRVVNRAPSD